MAQSGKGRIELFEDCFNGVAVGSTALSAPLGPFRVFGNGINEVDSGAPVVVDALSGAIRLTTTDEAEHAAALGTPASLSAEKNGVISAEARVQLNNLDTKEVYFGFSDVVGDTAGLEGSNVHGATTTVTLTASDLCGFLLSAELTEDEMWHFVHNGGATAGVTDSTELESGVDAVAGEWDVLRIEIDPNGTARWYINGALKKTLEGAVATTVALACFVAVEAKGVAVEECDVDYLLVRANRDWDR